NGDVSVRAPLNGTPAEIGVARALNDVLDQWQKQAGNAPAAPASDDLCRFAGALHRGRAASRLPVERDGKPLRRSALRLTPSLNGTLDQLAPLASEVSSLVRGMESEGKLGGEIRVPGATGHWKDLARDVNRLARHLTSQVRAIAEVAAAVADGDLTRSIP